MSYAMREQANLAHDFHDLVEALKSVVATGNDLERCLAVQSLGRISSNSSVDAVIGALRDADPDVRCDAANALAAMNEQSACEPLIANLRDDPIGEAKVRYVKALQCLAANQCGDLLNDLVIDRSEATGVAWDDEYSEWDDWLDVQRAAIEALGSLGEEGSAVTIVQALIDPDGQDLWPVACRALAKLGRPGVQQLQLMAAQASALNRKRIAAALAAAKPELAGPLLSRLASDKDVRVRVVAMESAAATSCREVLNTGIGDIAPEVRVIACSALVGLTNNTFEKALNDSSQAVRIAACNAIVQAGKPVKNLGLVSTIERSMRTKSPDILAAMISAAIVAEPSRAAGLIADICNHKSTDAKVRRVCLRAVAQLDMKDANDLLATAITDSQQSIRMEAIAALAELAKAGGVNATASLSLLAETLSGNKIPAPRIQETADDDTVVQFVPRKGSQAAGDDGDAAIKLDREGNELPAADVTDTTGEDAAEADQQDELTSPLSTLQAITAVNPDQMRADRTVELDEADLSFLEMTGSLVKRRKLDPDAKLPAHIDVRRLAATVAGDTGSSIVVPALADAATSQDKLLSEAALSSLKRLADGGVDVSAAEDKLLNLAGDRDVRRCCQAIAVLPAVGSPAAVAILEQATKNDVPQVRAAAITALAAAAAITEDTLVAATSDADPKVRFAAVKAIAKRANLDPVPMLLHQAQIDQGRYKHTAAELLADHVNDALPALTQWIADPDAHNRCLALEILPIVLAGAVEREEEMSHGPVF